MSVWIEKYNNEIADDYIFSAYLGFYSLGFKINFFNSFEEIEFKPNDIVVSSIQITQKIMNSLNISLPNLYIPTEVYEFCGRKIWKSTLKEIIDNYKKTKNKVFIKSVNIKEIPSQIIDFLPLITYENQELDYNIDCYVSEIVDFVSEWRVFISNYEVVGCQNYLGDFKIYPDWNIINSCMKKLKWQPKGWTMDFGITKDNKTLLIETNDGYSIGNYGLDGRIYAKLLLNRWNELIIS